MKLMPPFLPGAVERPRDDRDILLGAVQAPVQRPATYLPDNSWLVRNYQGHTTFCGEHAGTHLKAILDHLQDPTLTPRYSPRYGVIKLKAAGSPLNDGYGLTAGTDMRSIFKWLQTAGAARYEPLENDVTLPLQQYADPSAITPTIDADAGTSKILSYAFAATDFNSLCDAIYQNGGVLLLIKCDDGFWGTSTPNFTDPLYGHFIILDGYDQNRVRAFDSADPNNAFAVKMIGKQFITPMFIKEAGTALDIPIAKLKQIVQATAQTVQVIQTTPAPAAQKQAWYSGITQILQSLLAIFSPKVGSASPNNMSPAILGFLRGAGYSALGGAIAGVIYFLSTQPFWALIGGLGITGIVAAWEHSHNIPTFTSTPQ